MLADTERNKATVQAFYERALNERDADAALRYVGANYKQHNPLIEDDRNGLRKYLGWITEKVPRSHSRTLRVFADGDHVLLHVHRVRTPGARGHATIDIFRLEDGQIVEHRDVVQPVPETAAHANTMF
jgi:predicted SnoaL-like aldol condensation-catalyzing enzyme